MKVNTFKFAIHRIQFIMAFEPSWIAEFISGGGLAAWAYICLISKEFSTTPWDSIVATSVLLFGILRLILLFRLWYMPRAFAALAGHILWLWITFAFTSHQGLKPAVGLYIFVILGDLFTVLRFSLPYFARVKE